MYIYIVLNWVQRPKKFDVKVFKKAQQIIDNYGVVGGECVFKWNKDRTKYRTFRGNLVRDLRILLKKLDIDMLPKNTPISSKSMRHSFRTIAIFFILMLILRAN